MENKDPKSSRVVDEKQKQAKKTYYRRLIPRQGVILQYEPMLYPAFCSLRLLVQRTRFQYLILKEVNTLNRLACEMRSTSLEGMWAKKHRYEFVK